MGVDSDRVPLGHSCAIDRAGKLGRRLEAGLRTLRARDDRTAPRAGQVQVVVLGACGPVVPLERRADRRPGGDDEGVPLVSRRELAPAVGVRVHERAAPVLLRAVAGRVHPEDARRSRGRDDALRRPGRAGAVTPARVEPARRVVDDLDALRARVTDREPQPGGVPDADEVEVRGGRDLGDDLGNGRAVTRRLEPARAAEVDLDDARGQISVGVAARVPVEPEIDDGDLDSLAVHPGPVPGRCSRGEGSLPADRFRNGPRRLAQHADRAASRECPERRRRDDRFDNASIRGLDAAAVPRDEGPRLSGPSGQQLDSDRARERCRETRVEPRRLVGARDPPQGLVRRSERARAARRSAHGRNEPTCHPQDDAPQPALPSRSH